MDGRREGDETLNSVLDKGGETIDSLDEYAECIRPESNYAQDDVNG